MALNGVSQQPENWQLDILDMSGSDLASYQIVDIREAGAGSNVLQTVLRREILSVPNSKFDRKNPQLDPDKNYLFVCERGSESKSLVSDLRQSGYPNVFSVNGGYEAVRRKYLA